LMNTAISLFFLLVFIFSAVIFAHTDFDLFFYEMFSSSYGTT
jgi:hypothetical protein